MSLKTLHLTNAWHKASGGIGTFYRALLEAANENGHYLRLVVPGETTLVEEVGAYGRIYYIEAPLAPFNSSYRMLYPHRFLFPKTAIQNILNQERPDLVEVSEKYTMPYLAGLLRIGSLRGVPFRPTTVGLTCERMDENMAAYFSTSRTAAAFCRWYMKWIYFPLFDHHIAVSEHAAEELRPASRGHKVQRGVWIRPMGADCTQFTPANRDADHRAQLLALAGAGEHSRLLVYAGRLAPEKNLGLLEDAVALLRGRADYRLLIAGVGAQSEALKATCDARLPGLVTFLGHVGDRGQLARLFANADVFIHPNPREPFGIAPLEAMASGLPLVAPGRGGITTYANGGNAWLAEPTPPDFAAAIEQVFSCPDDRERRVASALLTARQFEWRNVAQQFLSLYQDLHTRTLGRQTTDNQPRFVSTAGNYFGRETNLAQNVFSESHLS